MTILVTGGAGFIGSNFIHDWISNVGSPVINIDKLTYAGNLANLEVVRGDSRHLFFHGDICDTTLVSDLLRRYQPRALVHLAAESHVDRSIATPDACILTNVNGTFSVLEAAKRYWDSLHAEKKSLFRFLYVSTDEVYGSIGPEDPPAPETAPFAPNSPYSASKAAADHLVRAYQVTYGFPTITVRCSNNYGPFQYPEKLIPLLIRNALRGDRLPIYGDGQHVRDWLYVADHCLALRLLLENGGVGQSYNIGGGCELTNNQLAGILCNLLDGIIPRHKGSYRELITHVPDRPGHDRRYAVDSSRIRLLLGWSPSESVSTGLRRTVKWYVDRWS